MKNNSFDFNRPTKARHLKMLAGVLVSTISFVIGSITLLTVGQSDALAEKTFNLALITEPPQLNSTRATDTVSGFILGHLMEGLTRYGKNGEAIPGVATEWTVNDKSAVFKLRKNAKWSDGSTVTAHDFVFGWRLVVDPKTASEYAFIMYFLKNAEAISKGSMPPTALGVTAKDDYTLEITFEKPCGYFVGLTAFATYFPVQEKFYASRGEKYGADAKDILTNGPFALTEWTHGASLTMDKNKNYWNASAIHLDRIAIPHITPDPMARFNFFKNKEIDEFELDKDTLPLAQKEGFKMKNHNDGSVYFMEFNFQEGKPTRSKSLRKAIQLVFNTDEYVKKIVSVPGTKPGTGLVPGWVRGVKDSFRKEFPFNPPKVDVAAAKKLIEAAKKELKLAQIPPLVWLTGDTPLSAREAEYFQSQFKTKLGIELKIDKQIFKQRLAKMTSGEFDIVAAGWGPDYADPMTYADLKTSWNENNRGRYSNPEVDALIKKAQATSNQKIRMEAMAAAEKIVLDDVAILPTYERNNVYVTSDRVDGVIRRVIGADPDLTFVNIK